MTSYARKHCLWLLAFLTLTVGRGQSLDYPMPLSKMTLRQWTGDHGLISNNLTSVFQTSDRFIWVTSFNGVHRFDGKKFKLYDKENVDALTTNAIYSLAEIDSSIMLLSSQGSGVIRYEKGSFSSIPELQTSSVRITLTDRKGRTWIGTNNEGLFRMDSDGTSTIIENDFFVNIPILEIIEDARGAIWLGGGMGLVKYDEDRFTRVTHGALHAENITALFATNNSLLVGTSNGLYSYDPQTEKVTAFPEFENIEVNDIVGERPGMFLVATERGLFRFRPSDNYSEVFNEKNGLPSNQISSVIIDHEGSIWISTKKAGLIRLNQGAVTTLGTQDGLLNTRINIIYEHRGKVLVGSDDGSLFMNTPGGRFTSIDLMTKSYETGIRDLEITPDGTLWVASYLGLLRYSDGEQRLFTTDDGLSSNMIRRILKTRKGELWLASRTGGVFRFDGNKQVEIYDTNNGLNSNYILALEEDIAGNLVVGTHSGGLSIISHTGVVTTRMIPGIDGALIFNIHIDEQNTYWLSTNIGIYIYQKDSFQKIEFEAGFKTETFFDLVYDLEGYVWLTTNIGIVRVTQQDMSLFSRGKIAAVNAQIYDNNDGMESKECTGATRSILTSDGEIWVPTIDGVAVLDPTVLPENKAVPNVFITSFSVDNQSLTDQNNRIEPGKVRYQFEFASTSYIAPDKVKFRYKLSGIDGDWIESEDNTVEYTNLPPSKYDFQVLASNNDDVWNDLGDSIRFIVLPYYYQTRWFQALIALAIGLAIYFIFVWRIGRVNVMNEKLIKVNEELDRFVYSASHDLRAPLTSILGLSQIARSSTSVEEKDQCFEMIEKSVYKLDEFIKDIIEYSRNQRLEIVYAELSPDEEINNIFESLEHLRRKDKVKFTFETSITKMTTDYRRLRVILKNIIANAMIYHDASKQDPWIRINCQKEGANVVFRIRDNGPGIDKAIINDIFKMFYRGNTISPGSGLGLYISRENTEKLGGTIRVQSVVGEGTEFIVSIPDKSA